MACSYLLSGPLSQTECGGSCLIARLSGQSRSNSGPRSSNLVWSMQLVDICSLRFFSPFFFRFSSVPGPTGPSGGHEGRFSRDPLPVFSAGSPCEQLWHGQGCPLYDVVHPAFPLPTTALSTFQDALKNGFGEAVVACDMPEPCKFPSLNSCQRRFLWTHEEVDHTPHPVVGRVLQARRTEKFHQALTKSHGCSRE